MLVFPLHTPIVSADIKGILLQESVHSTHQESQLWPDHPTILQAFEPFLLSVQVFSHHLALPMPEYDSQRLPPTQVSETPRLDPTQASYFQHHHPKQES